MNHVLTLRDEELAEIARYYAELEIVSNESHIQHVFVGEDFRVTVYASKKVMFQGPGADDEVRMWAEILSLDLPVEPTSPAAAKPAASTYELGESVLGSDEVGTGDYFGPVVVTCAFVRAGDIATLLALGVKDSKKLTDEQIRDLAPKLKSTVLHQTVVLANPKYNEMIDKGYNLNKIKSYLHNHAIRKTLQLLKEPYDKIVVDQFTPEANYYQYLADYDAVVKRITFEEKAESRHASVATASILARYAFLEAIDQLNERLKLNLPLGAGPIVDLIGKRIVLERGAAALGEIAKVHFKNTERILSSTPKRP